jgi:pimeloyl-ACP methyl ester carboxylesterase
MQVLVLAILTGCNTPPRPMLPEQKDRGYIVMLPGAESGASMFAGTVCGLREAGIDQAIEIIEWGDRPFQTIQNLVGIEANRKRARDIASRFIEYHQEHPGRPMTLIGFSAGGGLALMAAEDVPDDLVLDRIILMAAAVSPGYDLTGALRHSRRDLISFYSGNDWLMIGLGTRIFGTVDRVKTDSAGHVGFREKDGTLLQTDGLIQIPWTPDWRRLGNDGGHRGWLAEKWAREVLAPLLSVAGTIERV